MVKQIYNPYLPSWEYVPDGEPHVFGDRVYVYGSHDRFGGPLFCMNDYVCWSAPVEDLSDWRCEGVIYRKNSDPGNRNGKKCLYAPDVCQGPDGRYYLYYAFDFQGIISVAVCDTPAGEYQYLGDVAFPDGHRFGRKSGEPFPFDPGVFVDTDGRVYLYSGFATKIPFFLTGGKSLHNHGGVVLELEPDMVTVKEGPIELFPTKGREGAFADHAFFEASSMRKFDGKYYFIYSSEQNHELCYAIGTSPKGPFAYGGTLVDIGDVFLDGRSEKEALNYLGNTHGSVERINGEYYVFYHRQTNRHSYSRQACAERILRTADGGFKQAEITSCGLNGKPLKGKGSYEARIACNLWSAAGTGRYDHPLHAICFRKHPFFTQSGKDRETMGDQYIANMRNGSVAGFKYFEFDGSARVQVETRGAGGIMQISRDPEFATDTVEIPLGKNADFQKTEKIPLPLTGVHPLYFRYLGAGKIDFMGFGL